MHACRENCLLGSDLNRPEPLKQHGSTDDKVSSPLAHLANRWARWPFPWTLPNWWASLWKASCMGVYLVSFFACLRVLLWLDGGFKPLHMVNGKMLIAALLMFLFGSLDVAFHLQHNIEAFIYFQGNPIEEFERTSYWINVMGMACYVAQTFVGDSILLFRCWIVYSRNLYILAIPMLFWLGTTVCGAMTIYIEATLRPAGALLRASNLMPFITSMLCLTLATNVTSTSLIVYRIWKIHKSLERRMTVVTRYPLTSVLVVLIESGLMYTTSIVILFILYMASNNAQYGVSNSVVQIIGITFNLIITSVDRGDAVEPWPNSYSSRSHLSHRATFSNNVPLDMIKIQRTVTLYPDKEIPTHKSGDSDSESRFETQWEPREQAREVAFPPTTADNRETMA